jgi:hypothetical protein
VTLVRDSYFEEFAEELAESIGAINLEMVWPLTCIDWEKAATQLKADYTHIEFNGEKYWAR